MSIPGATVIGQCSIGRQYATDIMVTVLGIKKTHFIGRCSIGPQYAMEKIMTILGIEKLTSW